MVRALKVEQAKELTKLRQEFELAAKELQVGMQLLQLGHQSCSALSIAQKHWLREGALQTPLQLHKHPPGEKPAA
jgi:hypothetical protein